MPTFTAPVKDMQFILHDVLKASEQDVPGYDELDRDFTSAILEEAAATQEKVRHAEVVKDFAWARLRAQRRTGADDTYACGHSRNSDKDPTFCPICAQAEG